MSARQAVVELIDVTKVYPLGKTEVHAVRGVSFAIEKGEFISITGPSGSGKSTILNMIGCIDTPTSGVVKINGTETSSLNDKQLTALRHSTLGFIFQSFNLIPVLDVYENIEFPLLLGKERRNKAETREWIDFLIEAVGLQPFRKHKPAELSGGQRQRVAIARALATKPMIVLADEPTANLDSKTGKSIIELMKKLNQELETTFIFSTHDPDIVEIADHVIRLQDGIVIADRAFFRLGKQTVNWGVGYFFSPADIINVGRIDPENPEAEREGPVALRLHLPSGRNNFYAYSIVGGKPGAYRLALAPKIEFVLGRSEVGAGLYYRADRAPRAMATLSTSLGGVSLFSEAVLSKGSDKRFVQEIPVSPDNPLGLAVVSDHDTVRFHGTAGARASYADPDGRFSVTAAGQYYYNGEGYDGEFSKTHRPAMLYLVAAGQLSATDLVSTGRHYAALSLSGTSRSFRGLAPSAFWLGNLSDGSGMLSLTLSYTPEEGVRSSISVSRTYGSTGSEFAPLSPQIRLAVNVTLSMSW